MIKALPQRDIGGQEVAMMNLQLPIMEMKIRNPLTDKFVSFKFITISLDDTRQVRNPKYNSKHSQVAKKKLLDYYAQRKIDFPLHPDLTLFSGMNLEEFSRNYYVSSNGTLNRHSFVGKNIIRFIPHISPSATNIQQMMLYSKYNLLRYRIWEGNVDNALGEAKEELPQTVIQEWEQFLNTDYAMEKIPTLSKERRHLDKWLEQKLDDERKNAHIKPTRIRIPTFAALLTSNTKSNKEDLTLSSYNNYDWSKHGRKYTETQLGIWKT